MGMRIVEICNLTGYSQSIVEKAVYKYRDKKSKDKQMEKYNAVFEMHNKGIIDYKIAKELHISPSTVKRYLTGEQHPLGLPSNTKIDDESSNRILDMYFNQKMSSVEISKELKTSKTTVMYVVNKHLYKSTDS